MKVISIIAHDRRLVLQIYYNYKLYNEPDVLRPLPLDVLRNPSSLKSEKKAQSRLWYQNCKHLAKHVCKRKSTNEEICGIAAVKHRGNAA